MAQEREGAAAGRPLRVGLVVGDFPVISETFVINIAAGLVERGHDVRLLAMSGQRRSAPGMHARVAEHDLAARTRRPAFGRALIAPFGEDGAEIRKWGPARRAMAFAAQAGMLARQPAFDIVHCQFATLGLQMMRHLSLGTLKTKGFVVHVRGQDVTSFPRVHGEDVYRGMFERADLVIANCEHFRRRAIELGARDRDATVIGSAIEGAQFVPGPPKGDGSGLRLVAIGRLVEKKGFADAIRATALAATEIEGLTLEIIGEGPLRPELERLIADLRMGEHVFLPGQMSHEEVVSRLSASDILLAPSVTARSGDQDAPVNTLKEGMAMELPVVATRHGGIPELVVDGETGYLVDERDPEGMAAAIRRLAAERPRWPEMGRRGRKIVLETYDQKVVMGRLVDAYRDLLRSGERDSDRH